MGRERGQTNRRPPLLWTGIIFALAANLLLITLVNSASAPWQTEGQLILVTTLLAALVAGGLTAFYTGQRGGMHACLGGSASVPLLAIFILPGWWQGAILAGAFCTLGGTLVEIGDEEEGSGEVGGARDSCFAEGNHNHIKRWIDNCLIGEFQEPKIHSSFR